MTTTRAGEPDTDEDLRRRVLDGAVETILELGFGQLTLERVAERTGTGLAAIEEIFPVRADLTHAILVRTLLAGVEFIGSRMGRHGDRPRDQLRAYIEANVEFIAAHRTEVRAVAAIAMNQTDHDGRTAIAHDVAAYDSSLAPVQDILRRGQEQGEFAEFPTRTTAMTLRAAIDAIGPQLSAFPDLDLAGYAAELVALFDRATQAGRTPLVPPQGGSIR